MKIIFYINQTQLREIANSDAGDPIFVGAVIPPQEEPHLKKTNPDYFLDADPNIDDADQSDPVYAFPYHLDAGNLIYQNDVFDALNLSGYIATTELLKGKEGSIMCANGRKSDFFDRALFEEEAISDFAEAFEAGVLDPSSLYEILPELIIDQLWRMAETVSEANRDGIDKYDLIQQFQANIRESFIDLAEFPSDLNAGVEAYLGKDKPAFRRIMAIFVNDKIQSFYMAKNEKENNHQLFGRLLYQLLYQSDIDFDAGQLLVPKNQKKTVALCGFGKPKKSYRKYVDTINSLYRGVLGGEYRDDITSRNVYIKIDNRLVMPQDKALFYLNEIRHNKIKPVNKAKQKKRRMLRRYRKKIKNLRQKLRM